jgi:lycopene cyclase domain-containing protein
MNSMQHLIYLAVDLFILIPFILKLNDPRLGFRRHRKSIIVFVVWDILAVHADVWSFNRNYIIGIEIVRLPIEEILFFISVAVTSVLVWEATAFRGGRD